MKIEYMLVITALALGAQGARAQDLEPRIHRLQFDGPIGPQQRAALDRAGIQILEAAGGHAYLVRLPTPHATLARLDARIAPLPAEAKLSPELQRLSRGGTLPGGPLTLRAITALDRSIAGPAATVRELVGPRATFQAVQDASGRGHLWLRVEPENLVQAIGRLAAHPDVLRVERQAPLEFKNDNSSWLIQSAQVGDRTVWRNGLTGFGQVVGVADSGLDADACQFRFGPDRSDVTVATDLYDPPVATVMEPDNKVLTYYVIGQADAYDDASGGFHGTHTSGNAAGDNYENLADQTSAGHDAQDGMAPGARIVFQDIGSENGALTGLMGVSMFDLLLQAYDTGARVHNNSYGSPFLDVSYDVDSASIDQAAWELGDLLVVFAAGNSGADQQGNLQDKSLGGTGSTSKNTLTVGGSGPVELSFFGNTYQLAEDLLFFSSQGPTADSRFKPDLVAPGMVFSATTNTNTLINLGCCDVHDNTKYGTDNEDDNCNVDDSDALTFGTSFSSPIAGGAATLVRQYFTDGFWLGGERDAESGFTPSSALLKAAMIAGARPLTGVIVGMGTSDALTMPPSFQQGWGRIHLEDALWFAGDDRRTLLLDDVPNPVPGGALADAQPPPFPEAGAPLATGDERSWILPVPRSDQILKVALVWTDPAAAAGAVLTLVNDLNLEVIGPGGTYLGNKDYDGFGFSQPSMRFRSDSLNNLEVVTLEEPEAGWWEVKVTGQAVDGNGQAGSDAQGYALVVTGAFLEPTPLAIEPAVVAPGEVVQSVELTGEAFVPGMQVDLGPGLTAEGLEVTDANTATIATLTVAQDAARGPRDIRLTTHRSLTGVGFELLQVDSGGSGGGCGCGRPAHSAGLGFIGLLLLGALVAARRRDG